MSIDAISALGTSSIAGVSGTGFLTQGSAPTSVDGGSTFASALSSVDSLQQMQSTSRELGIKAVTGDLADVHDYTIASTQAAVALELTAAVRNRAVEAFNEIMRMQA